MFLLPGEEKARIYIPQIIMAVILLSAASLVKTFYKGPTTVLQLI